MDSKLDQILSRLSELTTKLDQQQTRIEKLEERLSIPKTSQQKQHNLQKVDRNFSEKKPVHAVKKQAFEFRFGKYALQIIGIAVFLFGMGFLLKYSIEQGWISPLVRIISGLAIATGLIAASEIFVKKVGQWAFGLSAGGIILYYLSVYAAYAFYNLLTLKQTFIVLCGITIGAAFLALRHNSRLIALFSLIGGMMAPLILYVDKFDPYFLMYYLLALAAGFVLISYIKEWFVLSWLSLLFLVVYKAFFINVSLGSALLFYSAVFSLYVLVPYAYALYKKINNRLFESYSITLASLYTFAAATNRIIYHNYFQKEAFESVVNVIVLLFANQARLHVLLYMSVLFGTLFSVLSLIAYIRDKKTHIFNAVSRLAILSFGLAIYVKMTGLTLSLAWYGYAFLLLMIGLLGSLPQVRWWSYLFWFFGFANFLLAGFDARISINSWLNNQITITAIIAILLFALASYVTQKYKDVLNNHEHFIYKRFDIGAVATCFYWISVVWRYPFTIFGFMWFGFLLFAIGIFCGSHLRRAAYIFSSIALAYFMYSHNSLLRMQSSNLHLLFASLVSIFTLMIMLCERYKNKLSLQEQNYLGKGSLLGLFVTLFFWGRATILSYFNFYSYREGRPRVQALLTVYYGAYALGLILIGLLKKIRFLRFYGLAVLGLTMYKLWFIIMGMPDTLHRIVAFILVGVLFILASFAYQMLSVEDKK